MKSPVKCSTLSIKVIHSSCWRMGLSSIVYELLQFAEFGKWRAPCRPKNAVKSRVSIQLSNQATTQRKKIERKGYSIYITRSPIIIHLSPWVSPDNYNFNHYGTTDELIDEINNAWPHPHRSIDHRFEVIGVTYVSSMGIGTARNTVGIAMHFFHIE